MKKIKLENKTDCTFKGFDYVKCKKAVVSQAMHYEIAKMWCEAWYNNSNLASEKRAKW